MAAGELSNRIPKKCLENSDIQISHICCEVQGPYKVAILFIPRFYRLKNDVVYMKPLISWRAELRLIKKRSQVTIMITSACDLGTVSGSIIYSGMKASNPVVAQKLAKWDYLIVIPSSSVEHAQNECLKDGMLTIHVKCAESKEETIERMHACSRREMSDGKKLSEDLKSVCRYQHETDFIFNVQEKIILVPKGILAARSEFLKEYPDNQNEMTLNTTYEALVSAIDYLYTSDIQDFEKLNEEENLEISNVASTLKINSLLYKCSSHKNKLLLEDILLKKIKQKV